jgi:1-acyl-sn-glycerol-3-phosphate acyltransferase
MLQWFGSVVFTIYLFVSVAIWGPVVLVLRLAGYGPCYRGILLWVDGTLWMLRILCGLRHEVEGLDHLPDANAVIFVKHSSTWETIAQLKLFPKQTWVMKRELLWAPILGWVLAGLRPIGINRAGGRIAVDQVVRLGSKRLAEGFWVIIFPEGTRVPFGQTKRYGISGTLLAQAAGRPIVPVAHNAGAFWPRRGWLKKRGTIRVVVGRPVMVAGRDPRKVNEEIQAWVESEIGALSD